MAALSSLRRPPITGESFIEHLPRTPTLEFEADYYCCEFPEELLREILVRLPSVDSIIKCTAVCKSWRSVIKSPTFIEAHLSRRRSLNRNQHRNGDDEDASLLLLERGGLGSKSYDLYWDKPSACGGLGGEFFPINETNCKSLVTPLVFKFLTGDKALMSYFNLAGTCNGLLCLANDGDCYDIVPTIICNPLLRKFVALPRPNIAIPQEYWAADWNPIQLTSVFGYDPRTNDYKVLRLSMRPCYGPAGEDDTQYGAELYSLARDSWKTLSPAACPFPGMFERIFETCYLQPSHVFCTAAVHWLLTAYGHSKETVIASFDMATESFRQIEVPQALRSVGPKVFLSMHEKNSLALIEVDRKRPICVLHLWVMQDYGVEASWTKLYSLPLGNLYQYHYPAPYPCLFGFESNGEQVFRLGYGYGSPSYHTVLLKVDFKTKQVNSGLVDLQPEFYDFMDSFVESLVLLNHSDALSY